MPRKSDIAGYPSMKEYPKWMYHSTEPPRMVKSEEEEMSFLDKGWSTEYIEQKYPKYVGDGKVAANPEEEAAIRKQKAEEDKKASEEEKEENGGKKPAASSKK